jgi:allophanate hydrolase subunit 1
VKYGVLQVPFEQTPRFALHAVVLGAFGVEQTPLLGLHVPCTWHVAGAGQVTGFDPVHVPFWQLSLCVHAFPSEQAAPLGETGLEQTPVVGSHTPIAWQAVGVGHVTGFEPVQVPF